MFGSRTTVKKVRNSLTWFSQKHRRLFEHIQVWSSWSSAYFFFASVLPISPAFKLTHKSSSDVFYFLIPQIFSLAWIGNLRFFYSCLYDVPWQFFLAALRGYVSPAARVRVHFSVSNNTKRTTSTFVILAPVQLIVTFAMLTHWVPLTVSLAFHLFDNFFTVVWQGLAACWRRTSERTLRFGSLHVLVFCFTLFHKVLGWSSCLTLSNQQACVGPCCFTGRPRPLGTGFFNGGTVLSFDLLLPPWRFLPYGFPRYRLAPVDCLFKLLCHRQSSLLATCSFLSSPCTNFGPTDFCHLRPRFNWFFNLFVAIFGLNDLRYFVLLQFKYVQFRIMICWLKGALPGTFFARRSHLSSVEQKKVQLIVTIVAVMDGVLVHQTGRTEHPPKKQQPTRPTAQKKQQTTNQPGAPMKGETVKL